MSERATERPTVGETTKVDYIVFVVSLILIIYLLAFHNEWFWLALPSLLTSLVKIFKVI